MAMRTQPRVRLLKKTVKKNYELARDVAVIFGLRMSHFWCSVETNVDTAEIWTVCLGSGGLISFRNTLYKVFVLSLVEKLVLR